MQIRVCKRRLPTGRDILLEERKSGDPVCVFAEEFRALERLERVGTIKQDDTMVRLANDLRSQTNLLHPSGNSTSIQNF